MSTYVRTSALHAHMHAILICDVMCYEDVYRYVAASLLGDGQVQGRHKLPCRPFHAPY